MKGQKGNSDGTKSSLYMMLNGSNFFLFCLDLPKTHSSKGFIFELTIRFYRKKSFLHKMKFQNTNIWIFWRRETETIEHILSDCEIVQALLYDFVTFCSNRVHRHISFAWKIVKLGSFVEKGTVKNLIDLQIKYYIYFIRCSNNNICLNWLILVWN